MEEVKHIRPKILEDLAKHFVDIYIEKSPIAAAEWIKAKIERFEIDRMRDLITREFISRGYNIPKRDNRS